MTQEELTEARIFALAAPTLLPLLERRKRVAFDRLRLAFREGKTDNTALVAELAVLSDLEQDIAQKASIYRTVEEQNAKHR